MTAPDCPARKERDNWCPECQCFATDQCWRGDDAHQGIGMTDKAEPAGKEKPGA